MTPGRSDHTDTEKEVLKIMKEDGSISQETIISELDLRSYEEASDIMRRLRYKDEVSFSSNGEFILKNSD